MKEPIPKGYVCTFPDICGFKGAKTKRCSYKGECEYQTIKVKYPAITANNIKQLFTLTKNYDNYCLSGNMFCGNEIRFDLTVMIQMINKIRVADNGGGMKSKRIAKKPFSRCWENGTGYKASITT